MKEHEVMSNDDFSWHFLLITSCEILPNSCKDEAHGNAPTQNLERRERGEKKLIPHSLMEMPCEKEGLWKSRRILQIFSV